MVKKVVSLVVALILVFSMASIAFAIPSPEGSSVVDTSDNVTGMTVSSLPATKQQEMTNAADAYIASHFGAGYQADVMLAVDLKVGRTNSGPATFALNVAGVKVGDNVLVIHQKADGSYEFVTGRVVANGVVEFTLRSFSPVCVLRVVGKANGAAPVMPKTGDSSNAASMVLLLLASAAVLVVCGKSLKSVK